MRKVTILVLALAFASTSVADVVHLKSGGKVEGRITKTSVEEVTIETQKAVLTFRRDVIEKVERGKSPLDTYREKLAAAKTVADYEELLLWCEANRFDTAEVKEKARDAVAARRRDEHPDTYCRECAGYGQVGCEKCRRAGSSLQDRGTGKAALLCTWCRGEGTESCRRCGGSGQVPCVRCKSSGVVVVVCAVCNGAGADFCRVCGGLGTIPCPSHSVRLGGVGEPCPTCGSVGHAGRIICPACRMAPSRWPCAACGATGRVTIACPSCLGRRSVGCMTCGHKGVVACSGCGGKGTVEGVCASCQGEGLVGCAACQGTGISRPKAAAPQAPAAR